MIINIGIGEQNKTTLKNRSSKVYFWYENKDKHFINVKTTKDKSSIWILESQIEDYLNYYLDNNYTVL